MKQLTTLGWFYGMFGLATCFYFGTAAIFGWHGPDWGGGQTSFRSGGAYHGSSYYRGSSYGRSSGGFWGGGK